VQLRVKDGCSDYYLPLTVMNQCAAVDKMDLLVESAWVTQARQSRSDWEVNMHGGSLRAALPLQVRVTSVFGEVRTAVIFGYAAGHVIDTNGQFTVTSSRPASDCIANDNSAVVLFKDGPGLERPWEHWKTSHSLVFFTPGAAGSPAAVMVHLGPYESVTFVSTVADAVSFASLTFYARASVAEDRMMLRLWSSHEEGAAPSQEVAVGGVTTSWQQYTVDLSYVDNAAHSNFHKVSWRNSDMSLTLYLDEIAFVQSPASSQLCPAPPEDCAPAVGKKSSGAARPSMVWGALVAVALAALLLNHQ